LLDEMRYACEVVGFMQIVSHGVSLELQQRHGRMHRAFFDLPQAVKSRLALREDCPVRGYFGKGGEDLDQVLQEQVDSAKGAKVAQQSRKDNKEALDMNGVPWSRPRGGFVARVFGLPSQLPAEEELAGFREVMEEYSREMFKLSRRVLSLMALVLGLPRNFFERHLTAPVATHRLLHYWPIKDFTKEVGVGEHIDYGLITILKQDDVGGLQVLNAKDRRWVHACPIDNAFVVNLGDMMGRWTAHRFKSTVHRVVNVSPLERYSVPFFLEPNMDTVIVEGQICEGVLGVGEPLSEHSRRCRLRRLWGESRANFARSATAEEILERFYRASGQLTARGFQAKR
jgi:isopenicillin N synthase-like dioxygenase